MDGWYILAAVQQQSNGPAAANMVAVLMYIGVWKERGGGRRGDWREGSLSNRLEVLQYADMQFCLDDPPSACGVS